MASELKVLEREAKMEANTSILGNDHLAMSPQEIFL